MAKYSFEFKKKVVMVKTTLHLNSMLLLRETLKCG